MDGQSIGCDEGIDPLDGFDDQYSVTMGLVIILERLRTCFKRCVDAEDMELLGFSLHHLFYCINILYQGVLPDLAGCSLHVSQNQPLDKKFGCQYCIWLRLQEIKRLLERLEPLCHLLNSAIVSVLASLDATRRLSDTRKLANDDDAEQPWQHSVAQERWRMALAILTDRLNAWQQCHDQRLSFTTQFADLLSLSPSLARMDMAFDLLLDNAGAIFGEILQDFQAISMGDDEATATLLLDLMQKVDQLLAQVDILLEPLQFLLKHYAQGAEML